jgi:hypothetical protein
MLHFSARHKPGKTRIIIGYTTSVGLFGLDPIGGRVCGGAETLNRYIRQLRAEFP